MNLAQFSTTHGVYKMHADYLTLVDSLLTRDAIVLDAGCGHGGVFAKSDLNSPTKCGRVIGIDYAQQDNYHITERCLGSLAKLPFSDTTFDVIVCEWVAEHIAEPGLVFKEFSRVLKSNGHLIMFMPNKRNPLVWLGAVLPTSLKDWLLRKLLNKEDRDLFPVYLRVNTPSAVRMYASTAGLSEISLATYPDPEYFAWNSVLLKAVLWLEQKALQLPCARHFNMYLLLCLRKTN